MNTSNITNYKPKDFAELLGVSVKTLQRWDREGILKANRTPTDRRYYTYEQYLQFKGTNVIVTIRQIIDEDISDAEKIKKISEVIAKC
jgi:DNA-binding transcriptional MerR regulator